MTRTTTILLSLSFAALLAFMLPAETEGRGRCTRTLDAGGNLGVFANRLSPGQTGCLNPGVYDIGTDFGIHRSGAPGKRITLTSANPRRPSVIRGRFWVADTANYWTFTHLRFDGRNAASLASPTVNGDFTTWRFVDVTNHRANAGGEGSGICFALGSTRTWGYANHTLIERSRIHECGVSDNHNHGIYVVAARHTAIRNNFIYANGDRGIQLYPDADDVLIERNVLDGNGEGVIFSGREGLASDRAVVRWNVISNSRVRFNIESYWPPGNPIGAGNQATENCLWASNQSESGWYARDGGVAPQVGFVASSNRVARPSFVSAARGDYRQTPKSACRAYGPRGRVP